MQRIPPFRTLDAFRGFAAIWVVMRHCTARWIDDGHLQYLQNPFYAFSIRGQDGVMLFFVISGYCITATAYASLVSRKSIWRFSYDRIRRIYPPYLAALIAALASILLLRFASAHHLVGEIHHVHALPAEWKFFVANLFLLQGEFNVEPMDTVFLSLSYEVAYYGIIGVFLVAAQWIASRRGMLAGILFLVAVTGVSTCLSVTWLALGNTAIFPFVYWHQFTLGGTLFFLLELTPRKSGFASPALKATIVATAVSIASLTVVYACLRDVQSTSVGNPSSRWACIIALTFAVILIGLRGVDDRVSQSPWLRPLTWVGAFSYALYLIHDVVIPYIDVLCRKAGLDGDLYWIAFCLQFAVALVAGRVFYLLVERHFVSRRQIRRLETEQVA